MAAVKCLLLVVTIWCLSHKSGCMMTGGLTPIDNKDISHYEDLMEGIEKAANLAQGQVKEKSDCKYIFLPDSLRVKSQVVQGFLYHVQADLAPSNRPKKNSDSSQYCKADSSKPFVYFCTFNVWSRVWLPKSEKLLIEDLHCSRKLPSK